MQLKSVPENGGLNSKISVKNEQSVWKQVRDIESENVVKYKSKFSKNGISCFSMEYIDGAIKLSKVLPEDRHQVINWAKQIFSGLQALHKKGIAHRDIRLENILLYKNGKIKICDFGLAKRSDLTITVCGTQGMMAPEVQRYFLFRQKAESKYDGAKFDVYSAAAVVYRLLFNITAEEMLTVVNHVLENGKPSLTKSTIDRFNNVVGEDLFKFFSECLTRDPAERATSEQALELLNQM
ncbi:MAG: Ser/Thr-protein kinase [Candidatus Paraimprobicoccus trichonymphae]|uniref:Ser/Thr-protein kinase n=1 Tax=Candidatus Paraimprobicoccus trichonymphae TaxID=3033793 RepID=A0AA48I9A1_9FIRM|nr:MAG: Ser/Thr-protein kinase [Candidatus Paraimprobicoccus trichonymphae]